MSVGMCKHSSTHINIVARQRIMELTSLITLRLADVNNASASGSVDKLVLTLLKSLLTDNVEYAAVEAAISSMTNAENDAPVALFNTSSSSDDQAGFQIGSAS